MISIEGQWKSQVDEFRHGKLSIMINCGRLENIMSGLIKIIHENQQDCVGDYIEFKVDIIYEINYDLIIDGKQSQIERLFIRQQQFGTDMYYTLQLTRYNGGSWQGSYATIYPNDLGELQNLQQIVTSETNICLNNENQSCSMPNTQMRKRKKYQ